MDTYGFVSPTVNPTDAWPTSFGMPLCEVDSSGSLTVTMFNDKMLSALDKVISLYDGQVGSLKMKDHAADMRRDARVNNMFLTNKAVFIPVYLDAARSAFADIEYDYGMLPYPKYDEAQTDYYTHSRDSISFFAYPITTPESDYEYLGTIMEALNIESGRTVHPAFYDNALKGRYSMDPNTAKMVDIIMDGITFDFSYQYGESHLFIPYMFRNCVTNGVNTLMTDYAAKRAQIEAGIEEVMSFYADK
ncbi:MAG: hypothetical protein IJV76_01200 [Clostridia bacterium]|nr:hypothetical protein [Clostridia bacterium]